MRITRKQLSEWKPCCQEPGRRYCAKNLDILFKGEDSISWQAILELKDVPPGDKIWLATRPGALPLEMQKQLISIIVNRAVKKRYLGCHSPVVKAWARCLNNGDRINVTAYHAANAAYAVTYCAADAAASISAERELQIRDLKNLIAKYDPEVERCSAK